jgi:hypothetical protein
MAATLIVPNLRDSFALLCLAISNPKGILVRPCLERDLIQSKTSGTKFVLPLLVWDLGLAGAAVGFVQLL